MFVCVCVSGEAEGGLWLLKCVYRREEEREIKFSHNNINNINYVAFVVVDNILHKIKKTYFIS